MNEDMLIAYGKAIKATETPGIVEGYLVAFTNPSEPDLSGEYFTAETDFGMTEGFPVTGAPALFHHAIPLKGTQEGLIKAVGRITACKVDDFGVWVQAALNMRDEYEQYIFEMAQANKLGWSSGALPQSVTVDEQTGHIKRWFIIEGSLTPTPAEPRYTGIKPVKSLYETDMAKEPQLEVTAPEATALPVLQPVQTTKATIVSKDKKSVAGDLVRELGATLTPEQLANLLDIIAGGEVAAVENEAMSAAPVPDVPMPDMASKAVTRAEFNSARKQVGGANFGAPATINHLATKSKWGNLSPEDASFALSMGRQMYKAAGEGQFIPGGSVGALGAVVETIAEGVKERFAKNPNTVDKPSAYKALAYKADELDYTTQATYGQEWVWDYWSNQLMLKARMENVVLSWLGSTSMDAKVAQYPVEWDDPTLRFVAESTDDADLIFTGSNIRSSKVGTKNITLTAKKLGLRTGWSSELDEDSIVNFVSQARIQADRAIRDGLDYVFLSGDTVNSNANINDDSGTLTGDEYFLAFNGMMKLPIITATTQGTSLAGSQVTYQDFVSLRNKMDRRAFNRTGDMAIFTNPEGYSALLKMDEFLTMDKVGTQATVLSGQIGAIGGIPVLMTAEMYQSKSNGKVSATPGNNIYARYLLAYKPYWKAGIRRDITTYLTRSDDGEAWQLIMTARADLATRPSNNGAALLYYGAV